MAANHLSRVVTDLCLAAAQAGGTLSDSQLLGRFIDQRDQAAFAALVRRHGPIVWGVCRRIVGHHQDSEDAFQATFLVLARKATVIQPREMLGNWLYGVARRTATKAKSLAKKRRRREKSLATTNEPTSLHHETTYSWEPIIDRELARLPEKYRVAIILCDLQNKTGKDAAALLKIPEGTLSSRLRTARDLLAKRLARHGLPLVGEALALILSQELAKAAVPRAARLAVIKAAPAIAAGQALTACSISPAVITLTEGVLNIMWISKAKIITGAVVALLMVGTGGFVSLRTMAVARTGEKAVAQAQREQPADQDDAEPEVKKVAQAQAVPPAKVPSQTRQSDLAHDSLNYLTGWKRDPEIEREWKNISTDQGKLLQERRDAAKETYSDQIKQIAFGRRTVDDAVLDWHKRWLDLELELAKTEKERLALLEKHWMILKSLERDYSFMAASGTVYPHIVSMIKYRRLSVQADYVAEKTKAGKK